MRRSALAALLVTGPWLTGFRWQDAVPAEQASAATVPFDEAAVVRALEDPAPETRAGAATRLARRCSAASTDALVRHVDDENEEVRLRVLRALATCPASPQSAAVVRAAHDTSPVVRIEALRALATLDDPSTTTVATEALDDESEDVRIAAIEALAKARDESATTAIAAKLDDARPGRIVDAVFTALMHIGSADALDIVLGGLDVPSQRQRARAAIEGARDLSAETRGTLVRLVAEKLDAPAQDARNAALAVLVSLAATGPIDGAQSAVARRFERDGIPSEDLARLFAMSTGEAASMPLLRALAHENPSAITGASAGLLWLAEHGMLARSAIDPVHEAFSRSSGPVAERLFEVLASLHATDVMRIFEAGFAPGNDEATLPRPATLVRHRYALPIRMLERYMRSENEEVRAAGFALLAQTDDDGAAAWIADLFASDAPIDRVSLATALRSIVTRTPETAVPPSALAVGHALLAYGSEAQRRDAFVIVATADASSPRLSGSWERADSALRAAILLSFGERGGEPWVRRGLVDDAPRVRAAALFAARGVLSVDELRRIASERREARFPEDVAAAFVLRERSSNERSADVDVELVLRDGSRDLPRAKRLVALRFEDGGEVVLPADVLGRVTLRRVPRGAVVVSDPFAVEPPRASSRSEASVHTP